MQLKIGQLLNEEIIKNSKFNRPRVIHAVIKRRASEKKIECSISIEDIRSMTPTHCPVFGVELSYDTDYDTSPSVDRLDATRGYS